MVNGPMFESRLHHCPSCDKVYYHPERPNMPYKLERTCSRCYHYESAESDDDRPPSGPVDEYPLSE